MPEPDPTLTTIAAMFADLEVVNSRGGYTLVHNLLDDGEQIEGRAGEAVDSRHRHHVAGAEGFQHRSNSRRVGCAPLAFSL
jgi:hypothetical protein